MYTNKVMIHIPVICVCSGVRPVAMLSVTRTAQCPVLQGQQLRESLRSVQVQLSETSNLYIAQGDKLREVRRSRMELDQENTTLKTTLNRTKVH